MNALTLTIDCLLKLMMYPLLLSPSGVSPPNMIALVSSSIVRLKSSIGGGLSPIITGESH